MNAQNLFNWEDLENINPGDVVNYHHNSKCPPSKVEVISLEIRSNWAEMQWKFVGYPYSNHTTFLISDYQYKKMWYTKNTVWSSR